MGTDQNMHRSGDGTRSTTDAGVDNIGAGEKFATGHSAAGNSNVGPAPHERLQEKRADAASSKRDDSVPFNLRAEPEKDSNVEQGPPPVN